MKPTRPIFGLLIIFSVYHLIRDIFQTYQIQNLATAIFKMDKNWCGPYCNAITLPFELFILAGSLIIFKRNRSGSLGKWVLAIFFLWLAMFLYDYFIFN